VILVRRIIFGLFAVALSLQGVAAGAMMHSAATGAQLHADGIVANEVTSALDVSTAAQAEAPCEHANAMHAPRDDQSADIKTAGRTAHSNHTNQTHGSTHADCAGALCCAAFISQSITTFRLPPARHALDVAVDFAVMAVDPATFDRPPRT
jgi:hypothetical protein